MTPISTFSPTAQLPDLSQGSLRRELPAEFSEMQDEINRVVMQDPLTINIMDWLARFREDFHSPLNTELVYRHYVAKLQLLLRDPYGIPLDIYPVLDVEDERTYSLTCVAVTRAAKPESQRHLSPMTGQPLTLVAHHLAAWMVRWLAKRKNALYSPELEATYLQLLNQERGTSLEERLDALDEIEAEGKVSLEHQLKVRRQQFDQQLASMRQEAQFYKERIAERIRCLSQSQPLQQVQREVQQAAAARPTISIPAVRQAMQQLREEHFDPLAQHAHTYATQQIERFAQTRKENETRLTSIQQKIAATKTHIHEVQQGRGPLAQEQQTLQQYSEELAKHQQRLNRNIEHLNETITRQEKENKQQLQLMRKVGEVAFSVLATWGLRCLGVPLSINVDGTKFSVGSGFS